MPYQVSLPMAPMARDNIFVPKCVLIYSWNAVYHSQDVSIQTPLSFQPLSCLATNPINFAATRWCSAWRTTPSRKGLLGYVGIVVSQVPHVWLASDFNHVTLASSVVFLSLSNSRRPSSPATLQRPHPPNAQLCSRRRSTFTLYGFRSIVSSSFETPA